MTGRRSGTDGSARGGRELGIGLFYDEEGSTTVAAAVAILVSLVLVFGLANVQWSSSRSADVQAVADAGALAGMNVVSAYVTIAQIADALVLTLGLIGMLTMAIGLVLSAIPVVDAAGPPVLAAATSVFQARTKLSKTAATGLSKLEGVVPYLVAANALLTVRANSSSDGNYVGVAAPYPLEGSSDFGDLLEDEVEQTAQDLESSGDKVDELSKEAAESEEAADAAKERAWRADCGDSPSMRERADRLAGLAGELNPYYPSTAGWSFQVPIVRARAYYSQRLAMEAPQGSGVDDCTRSAARRAFYEYALEQMESSSYVEYEDGTVLCDLRGLPRNTSEVRETTLYTDVVWPCTTEDGKPTIHSYAGCPGAKGASCGYASLAQEESGAVSQCTTCRFSVSDLGRTPSASTSISNGFEYHWKIVVEAAQEYQQDKNDAAKKYEEAKKEGENSADLFRKALEELSATRVVLSPPGSRGCICIVADPSTHYAPENLTALLGTGAKVPARVAISGAALAPDRSSSENNVLANFFDGLVAQGGVVGGVSSALDAALTVWGSVLVAYGNGYDALAGAMQTSFESLSNWGMGGISTWLKIALEDVVILLGIQPADMTAKKPVLVNTADVLADEGGSWSGTARAMVLAMGQSDVGSGVSVLLTELGIGVRDPDGSLSVTVAELEIPGTGITIPLTIDLSWLGEAA